MGSRRKREGIGPTESASKPRRRGRSGWRTSSRSAEAARRGKRHQGRGESLTRSLALPRRSSTQRRCPAAPSGRPACASRRHCRRRRPLPPPAPAAPPITSPRAPLPSPPPPAPPGRFRLESVSESQASPRKFPLAAPPLLAPPRPCPSPFGSFLRSRARSVQGDLGARASAPPQWPRGRPASPRPAPSRPHPFGPSGTGSLQLPSPVLHPYRHSSQREQKCEIRFSVSNLCSRPELTALGFRVLWALRPHLCWGVVSTQRRRGDTEKGEAR